MSATLDHLCEELSRETGTAFRVIRHPGPPGRLSRYQIAVSRGEFSWSGGLTSYDGCLRTIALIIDLVRMGYLPLKKEG